MNKNKYWLARISIWFSFFVLFVIGYWIILPFKALELKNITALHERAENLPEKFDFIVSRAVTAFPDFVKMTRKLISEKHSNAIPNGIIYLKGGDFSEEIASFKKTIEITEIPTYFDEPFFETKKIIYLPL